MAPHISKISIFCMQNTIFIDYSVSLQWKKVLLVEIKYQLQLYIYPRSIWRRPLRSFNMGKVTRKPEEPSTVMEQPPPSTKGKKKKNLCQPSSRGGGKLRPSQLSSFSSFPLIPPPRTLLPFPHLA